MAAVWQQADVLPDVTLKTQPQKFPAPLASWLTISPMIAAHMTSLEPGLYVRIEELDNGPKPFPLASGFSSSHAYRALGLYNPSETSDAYFVLSNDRDEVWFICNRHVRSHTLLPGEVALRLPIGDSPRQSMAAV